MPETTQPTAQQLESAFEAFNQISVQLASSYGDLQQQVASLTEELSQARMETLNQLAEKERVAERLEKLLQALPGGVLVLDDRGRILEVNPGAYQLLGNDIIDHSWEEIAASRFVSGSRELQLHDGRWVSLSVSTLEGGQGKILLLTDVSEAHRLQDLLNQHQRLTALGEMAAGLAHQIRTPLASVLLYLSQLENPSLDRARHQQFVAKTRERMRHMEHMINNMLAYVRGQSEDQASFRLKDVIDAMEQLLEIDLQATGGQMYVSNQAPDVLVRGNADALLGALSNLGINAIQSCKQQPSLVLDVSKGRQGETIVSLKDNGTGIDEAVQKRVFDPFFTTRPNGTGLGLAVVKAVVEGHGGSIAFDSSPGEGTTVTLHLPAADLAGTLPADMIASDHLMQIENQANTNSPPIELNEVNQ